MARRKASDKKVAGKKSRAASEEVNNVQADDHSIAFKEVHVGGDVRGDIRIGHTIGYTAEQVSVLLKQITTTLQPKKFDGRCPYKGLEVFEEEDAELFFGRERLVNELVGRVKESRTVFITGPSGSGKSSLVRAGLIHALKQGAIKSSDRWLYETMKPGREPIKDLALAFSRLKTPELSKYFLEHKNEINILNECAESVLSGRKDQRFVLFIDQFEEVFTQINSEEERVAFINMLAQAGTVENGRVIVLFAMRSDFVSNCATYPALNELLSQEFRQIGAMQPEELVSAIALPAMHVGLPVEDELIAQIINDMKGEPDALPLMQFALKDLFDAKQAEGGVIALTMKDYLGHGGIHKSLERHADATFAKLSESEQELTRSIFSGLIEIGRGTQDTKRTALFDELIPANTKPEEVGSIVQKLADARLIITDEQAGKDTVTISHEKLIEAWPWLKKLVNENRDAIALQNEIASDAKEWEDHKRDLSYLYSGARLANVREQLNAKKLVLSETSNEFVKAGQARQQRSQRTLIAGVSIVIALLFVSVIVFSKLSITNANTASTAQAASTDAVAQKATAQAASTLAVARAEEAQKQTTIARAGELAAQSVALHDTNLPLSLLLGIEAFRLNVNVQTRGALLDAANTKPQIIQFLKSSTGFIGIDSTGFLDSLAYSPNGELLAASWNGKIMLWDMKTRQPIGPLLTVNAKSVYQLTFSPDNKTLASISFDNSIILWDIASRKPIGQPIRVNTNQTVRAIAFSPDGKILASDNGDNSVIMLDVISHRQMGLPLIGHIEGISSLAFSPNGKMLASSSYDQTIILWDVASHQPVGQPLTGHESSVSSVAFSPDGKTLASLGDEIILWNITSPKPIGNPIVGPISSLSNIAFSPDGTIIASGCPDSTICLWDVASHQPVGQPLTGHTGFVISVAFSPDSKTLVSGSRDGTIILWDIASHQQVGQPLTGHTARVNSVAFSPDGKTLASGSDDKTIILWDIASHQQVGQPLTGHTARVNSVAFSPDGKMLASGSRDKTIILWDVATGKPIGQPLTGHTDSIESVAFSPDGKTLASGSDDGTIILWDIASHQQVGQPLTGQKNFVYSVAFSPDHKTFASGGGAVPIILWDSALRKPIGQSLNGQIDFAYSVAFSPNGKILASGSGDGENTIILWNIASFPSIRQRLTGHVFGGVALFSVAFSPDGLTLASDGGNELILWDVASGKPIGQTIIKNKEFFVEHVAFSPDGKLLATGGDGLILWDLNPSSWIEQSCQRAGGNFTRAEWAKYLADQPYPTKQSDATCPHWPLEPEATPSPVP